MTLVIPPGFGNAAFVFSAADGTPPFVTTIGVDLSAWTDDFVGCANFIKAGYFTHLGPATDSDLTLDRVTLAIGFDGPGGSVDSDTPPLAMTRTSTGTAFALSAIARKVTNTLGRRGRGRMFLPGTLSQTEVGQDGSVAPARITDLTTRLGEFHEWLTTGDVSAIPAPPFLLHSDIVTDPSPITGFAISDLVGIQRRRIR